MGRVETGRRSGTSAGTVKTWRERDWSPSPWGYLAFTGWAALATVLQPAFWTILEKLNGKPSVC